MLYCCILGQRGCLLVIHGKHWAHLKGMGQCSMETQTESRSQLGVLNARFHWCSLSPPPLPSPHTENTGSGHLRPGKKQRLRGREKQNCSNTKALPMTGELRGSTSPTEIGDEHSTLFLKAVHV